MGVTGRGEYSRAGVGEAVSGVCSAVCVFHVSAASMLCLLCSRHCQLKHRVKTVRGSDGDQHCQPDWLSGYGEWLRCSVSVGVFPEGTVYHSKTLQPRSPQRGSVSITTTPTSVL